MNLPASLLPEAVFSKHASPSAAVLTPSWRRTVETPSGGPVLHAAAGILRAPPVSGRRTSLASLTLSRTIDRERFDWPSRILARADWLTDELRSRATAILHRVADERLGGAWWGAEPPPMVPRALILAGADDGVTRRMIGAAVAASGASGTVLVTARPQAIAPLSRGLGLRVVDVGSDPWPLIEAATHIHAAGDAEGGLLAAFAGKRVRCHSPGPLWLTDDPVRLAAACLILGTRYIDPFSGQPIGCEAFLDLVGQWRRRSADRARIACCLGISFWKRRRMTEFLGAAARPAYRRTAQAAVAVAARRGGAIAVWPSRAPAGLDAAARAAGVPVIRVEDGFVRSAGLGADFLPPLSIVLDRLGLYYDATAPSDLESILMETRFTPAMAQRAAALRDRMVRDGVTKYNLSGASPLLARPSSSGAAKRIVLVPGQVADDRSVLLGGGGVRPGLDLLARVRAQAPGAFIVYKPHPDVEAGHRLGAVPDREALRFADQVVRGGSMAALLDQVDEVHTLTSLTGFEALLRGKPVTTYGQPFYAGWGLSTDVNPPRRRGRRLTVDELVCGALILYPHYLDPVTFLPCGPEIVLDRLAHPGLRRATPLILARRMQGRIVQRARRLRLLLQSSLSQKGHVP